ncbi:hypothetical protein PRIC1_014979 [Phytophthora ramorum]
MISFDTFSGPRGRVREAELDPQGLLVLAEHPTPVPQLFPAIDESPEASDSDDSEFYESQDDSEDSSDLFHEHDDAEPAQDAGHDQEDAHDAGRDQEHASGGRIRRVVELLTLQSHNVRSALVDKLLGVVKVHELLLTRATEEQIANAANDAITDEILESVDQEERRRSELALKEQPLVPLQPVAVAAPTSTLFGPGHLSPFRVLELVDVLDSTTGGMVKRVLTNVRRRAPLNGRMMRDNEMERDVEFCRFCSAYGDHTAAQHRCRLCGLAGHHRSRSCSYRGTIPASSNSSGARPAATDEYQRFCTLCDSWGMHATERHRCRTCGAHGAHRSQRKAAHATHEHLCRVCRAVGLHRSDGCPQRSSSNTVLSYSVDAASKVRDRVLEKIPQVLPPPAATLVWRSLDKVGDADLILRKTLQRIGVWGGGSQTPITTPYAPPRSNCSGVDTSSDGVTSHDDESVHRFPPDLESSPCGVVFAPSSSSSSSVPLVLDEGRSSGVYVLSYAEGGSVVPARILKYMRLLMHHEVPTNAFSVVVRFDPRPSHWELMKPGMVSPRSLPSSPSLSHQLQKRMTHYTLQTLLGARDKLRELESTRHKLQHRQQQIQAQLRSQEQDQQHLRPGDNEERQVVVPVDA